MTMTDRAPAGTRRLALWLLALACCSLTGCNLMVLAGYLIGGPPSIEPNFETVTGQSFTDKDVKVAVVCYAPKEVKWDFEDIDRDLGKFVTFRLAQHKVEVVNPDRVQAWLDQNADWDKPEEIGEAFDVKYVVYIDLTQYSLFEENSHQLWRGRAEAIVSVYEMGEDAAGERIYSKELISRYPLHRPLSMSEETYWSFKKKYLSRLSEEIGRLFYEHYNGDDFIDG